MDATAPSHLLPASRDSLKAVAIVQETPLAPCLLLDGQEMEAILASVDDTVFGK